MNPTTLHELDISNAVAYWEVEYDDYWSDAVEQADIEHMLWNMCEIRDWTEDSITVEKDAALIWEWVSRQQEEA